ncbi:hypothetical protein D0Z00_000512 [Geotrichum galactomycetum]|uniref:Uncharacterized protein n=1 Tax=Geotrichum galactomycetum TaxID=27317 RepID=A0ACB6V9W9_9ASCO|nr:hypothetical protein D0Z00_000512 [Geotrichum candidum]
MPYADPFASFKIPGLGAAVKPLFGDYLGYTILPDHVEEVIFAAFFYHAIYLVSSIVSPRLVKGYNSLSRRTQLNFDIHVVSHVQAILILALSFPLFGDADLAKDRIYSYTPYAGFVSAMAVGYFVWDTYICIRYFKMFGLGFAIHGIGALFVFLQSMRPLLLSYSPHFLLFELSTPFLNVNWFASHLPEGSISFGVQKINGLFLMATFFSTRIIWGFYQAFSVVSDLFFGAADYVPVHPLWASIGVCASNLALDVLNVYWFYKMVLLAKRALASGSGSATSAQKKKKDQ